MPLPAVQHNHYKTMYGENVAFYEIAVNNKKFKFVVCGRGIPINGTGDPPLRS